MSKQEEINRLTKGLHTVWPSADPSKNSIILHYQNTTDPGMRISYNLTHAMQTIPIENLKAIIEQARLIYQKRVSGPIT